jgi:predicted metal-dependent hydrolase
VNASGEVIIRAPLKAPLSFIQQFIKEKESWILKTVEKSRQRNQDIPVKSFSPGEQFLYLGHSYPLLYHDNRQREDFFFNQGFFLSVNKQHKARELFHRWYLEQAGMVLSARSEYFSHLTGLEHTQIRITNPRTRWGSCSPSGNLNFNWRLIMAPLPVLDYVVLHEIVHLEIKNHSRKFWDKVGIYCPDYAERRRWLKNYGHKLEL